MIKYALSRSLTGISFALAIGAAVAANGAIDSPAHAQSYNCNKARLKVEHLICANGYLGSLDVQMASLYYNIRGKLGHHQKKQLAHDQKHWLKYRNECGYSAPCVEHAYNTRIHQLYHWLHALGY